MTRCNEFYCKVERDGNFCNMDEVALHRVLEYIKFCKENNLPLGSLSERAARPLIKEKNPVIKAKVIESIGKQLNKGRAPTARQVTNLVQNVEDGKSNRGGDHKGAEIIEQVVPKTDLEEEIEPDVETVVEDFVDPTDDDIGGMLDIPVMPAQSIGEIVGVGEGTPPENILVEEKEEEEDTNPGNLEITEKVVKEYLRNAGHKDVPQKTKPLPTEGGKQAIFDKCIKQAFEWGMDGDEIARRMKKAIVYVYPSGSGSED